ncbi:THAP domain-containing protein 6-like isoform X2 [Siphateles boraxobius]|uniref:THAP domain-containing protein 6-like isoform X2 n=1 Tax=Siphateles boraxobius TaxID=180520 RepID=UPI0040644587
MPTSCAAWGCTNRRTIENRSRGITFHKFPKDKELRRQWEVAVRRQGFSASDFSVLCSEHFKSDHFDRTGQTVRIRDGAKPSVFSFPTHLQRPVAKTRTTQASRKAEESLLVDCSQHFQETDPPLPNVDHTYALPASPADLKARLCEALARVESLEREKRNVKDRERRAKSTVHDLLEDLKGKNLINEDLKERLNFYSDLVKTVPRRVHKRAEGVCPHSSLTWPKSL